MTRPMAWLRLGGLILVAWLLAGVSRADTQDLASTLVRDTSERMLKVLEERRSDLDKDPRLIYQLVNEIVVPGFDFERITRFALGRYWRDASAEQRSDLVGEFQQLLVRTYAKALLNYSGQEIRYSPLRPGSRPEEVTVHTEVSEAGGPPVPIDYQLYLRDGAWKVYDVAIDGISLVVNYRSSFASQIRSGGIEGLIQTLRERNRDGAS